VWNKVISISSVKNPTDAISITLNLAAAIHNKTKENVAVIDLSFLSFHELAELLNTKVLPDVSPLLSLGAALNKNLLRGFLYRHPSGIDVISSPPMKRDLFSTEFISSLISEFRELYTYTLLLTTFSMDDKFYNIIGNTNLHILLLPVEKYAKNLAEEFFISLARFHLPAKLCYIVLNYTEKMEDKSLLSEIRNSFRDKYLSEVCCAAVANDCFIVNTHPERSFSQQINAIAEKLISDDTFFVQHVIKPAAVATSESSSRKDKDVEKLALKAELQKYILENIETMISYNDDEKTQYVRSIIEKILSEKNLELSQEEKKELINDLVSEILGLGPIERLLRDTSITEIMVNGKDEIYIERDGKIYLTEYKFNAEKDLYTVIDKIVSSVGRRIDDSSPLVDARLKDGSRVNIVIPPISLNGPVITIRKFKERHLAPQDLINYNSANSEVIEFIKWCIWGRKNIIISGGTGSGKTTLLNILASFIPEDERIITIEDSAELKLPHKHWIRLEARPPNIEGKGEITIRQLLINALRMRPDRIIIGECRGGEALDMLQAMNTGHEGSLTTLHANSPRDVLSRLETLVLMSGMELPIIAIRQQIASAIDLIIQVARLQDGTRKIVAINEVVGLEGNTILMAEIFKFIHKGWSTDKKIVGEFKFTGIVPTFMEELKVKLPDVRFDIFRSN